MKRYIKVLFIISFIIIIMFLMQKEIFAFVTYVSSETYQVYYDENQSYINYGIDSNILEQFGIESEDNLATINYNAGSIWSRDLDYTDGDGYGVLTIKGSNKRPIYYGDTLNINLLFHGCNKHYENVEFEFVYWEDLQTKLDNTLSSIKEETPTSQLTNDGLLKEYVTGSTVGEVGKIIFYENNFNLAKRPSKEPDINLDVSRNEFKDIDVYRANITYTLDQEQEDREILIGCLFIREVDARWNHTYHGIAVIPIVIKEISTAEAPELEELEKKQEEMKQWAIKRLEKVPEKNASIEELYDFFRFYESVKENLNDDGTLKDNLGESEILTAVKRAENPRNKNWEEFFESALKQDEETDETGRKTNSRLESWLQTSLYSFNLDSSINSVDEYVALRNIAKNNSETAATQTSWTNSLSEMGRYVMNRVGNLRQALNEGWHYTTVFDSTTDTGGAGALDNTNDRISGIISNIWNTAIRDEKEFVGVLQNINEYSPFDDDISDEEAEKVAGIVSIILSLITNLGMIVAVIMVAIMGLKYMLGSVEEKVDYKKDMIPYLVGAILLFGITSFVKVLQLWGQNINNI